MVTTETDEVFRVIKTQTRVVKTNNCSRNIIEPLLGHRLIVV